MNRIVVILLSLISNYSCAHICPEDGLYANPTDSTSYFECSEGKAVLRSCPIAGDGLSYQVFNGDRCVNRRSAPDWISCPPGSYYDNTLSQCRVIDVVEPYPVRRQAPGDVERYQVRSRDITCPPGYTYNTVRGRCMRRIYLDAIGEHGPSQVRYEKGCPTGYEYVEYIDKCRRVIWKDPRRETYSRYRRNGRFETDLPNGQVKIETWYELPWLWRNNPNQSANDKILPDRYNNLAG